MSFSLLRAADEVPDRIALIAEGRERTYGELAGRVSSALASLTTPEHPGRVAVVADARLDTATAIHALLAVGARITLIHPRLTAGERAQLIARSRADRVIDESWCAPEPGSAAAPPAPTSARAASSTDDACAVVVYTSGTAGAPKGVQLSRRALLASARASAANLGWRTDDRWLCPIPLAHVGGLSVLLRCLHGRACAVLAAPDQLAATIARHRVTIASLVPPLLAGLLDEMKRPPPHLRAILLGGAAAPASLLQRASERGFPVLPTYGMSEAASQIATRPYGCAIVPATVQNNDGIGPPLAGIRLRIADGRVQVAGDCLMNGYEPPDDAPPAISADGWLDTGDLGHLDDRGWLHVVGRADDLIITGGENVSPAEVERVLRASATVADACVVGLPDPQWGQLVAAALVLAPGDDGKGIARVRSQLKEQIASHKRPRRWLALDELPRTPLGKVDRRRVAEMMRAAPA